jgi:hypothetical protein
MSIRIFAGRMVGRCLGCCPAKKISMMRMRLPQHGQGCSGALSSSGFVVAALMASIGMSGTASKARIRAMLLARVGLVSRHVHQEAADELVGIERHHPVSLPTFEAVILPSDSDALVIVRDQAAVGDSDGYSARDSAILPRVPRMDVCCRPPSHGYAAAPNRLRRLVHW